MRLPLQRLLLLMALVGDQGCCRAVNSEWYLPPPQWEEGRWEERHTVKKRRRCPENPCRGLKILQGVP